MTEKELRQKVADIITSWVGATKGSAKHLEILAIYNGHKPLARGYTVKTTDAYCATTVSAAYIKAGIAEYTGTECGVEKYVFGSTFLYGHTKNPLSFFARLGRRHKIFVP